MSHGDTATQRCRTRLPRKPATHDRTGSTPACTAGRRGALRRIEPVQLCVSVAVFRCAGSRLMSKRPKRCQKDKQSRVRVTKVKPAWRGCHGRDRNGFHIMWIYLCVLRVLCVEE